MRNKLTDAERAAPECPDCGGDSHGNTCRRLAMGTQGGRLDIQTGPPWNDWPDGLAPVNPLAKAE